MAKKMISVKVNEGVEELLKKLAEANSRSQGQQIEYMIKQECERLGLLTNPTK